MSHRFGLFDVDSRELDGSRRQLGFRPRVVPLASSLQRLYALAAVHQYPLVFTTCCSGSMPGPSDVPGMLYIPLDPADLSWLGRVEEYQLFHVAKKAHGDPARNSACRAYDMFQDNPHVSRLLRALQVETWVVFGNGFDLCVGSAARGILDAGLPLIVLEDVRISNAGGTAESERNTFDELRGRGARVMSLSQFSDLASRSPRG